jgi:hypothetical protein
MRLAKPHPALGQAIQIRRHRNPVAITPNRRPQIINGDKQNIRLGGGGGIHHRGTEETEKYQGAFHFLEPQIMLIGQGSFFTVGMKCRLLFQR